MTAVIREADESDVYCLYALEKAASSSALGHVFGGTPFPADDVLARWQVVIDDPSGTVLVDELDGVLVGYAAFGDGWLRHLGVVPELWGTGRAHDLYAAVLARSAAAGSPPTCLWVLVENLRARTFYARLGWQDTGVREREVFAPYPLKMRMRRVPDEGERLGGLPAQR